MARHGIRLAWREQRSVCVWWRGGLLVANFLCGWDGGVCVCGVNGFFSASFTPRGYLSCRGLFVGGWLGGVDGVGGGCCLGGVVGGGRSWERIGLYWNAVCRVIAGKVMAGLGGSWGGSGYMHLQSSWPCGMHMQYGTRPCRYPL